MSLAFVMAGILTGLAAGVAVWIGGAGLGPALLAYVGCGLAGMIAAVVLALTSRPQAVPPPLGQPHS